MTRQELKASAKQQIKGNIGILFLISLIVAALSALCSAIPVVGSLAAAVVLAPALTLGMINIYLNLAKGIKPEIAKLFENFKDFWIAFKTTFFVGLFTSLWSLLFVIPGIIKGIAYSQAMYIVTENPQIGALEAIDRSKKMMDGHKMEFFILVLSFIGWNILAGLTFGILYIWLIPYMTATFTNFYNSIKPVAEPVVDAVAEPAEAAEPVVDVVAE